MITDTYSIFWREMKRYKKSRGGFIIRLIQPAVWIIVMGNIFSGTQPLIESVGFDGEYIEFMKPGIIILTAIFSSIFGGVNTLWDRRYGFMNQALTSPISRSSIALGKMLAISLVAAIQASLILGIALAIGVTMPNILMIAPIMAIVVLFSIGFSGISVMFAAAARSQETLWGTVYFLGLHMFMISPALFPLALMPDWLATIAQFNPVTYAVVLVRSMMSGYVESSSAAFSILILGGFVIAMTLLASYVFTREVNKPF